MTGVSALFQRAVRRSECGGSQVESGNQQSRGGVSSAMEAAFRSGDLVMYWNVAAFLVPLLLSSAVCAQTVVVVAPDSPPAPAPYNPPPVGTVIQTSAGTQTVTAVNGYDVTLQNDVAGGGGFTTLHALVQRQPEASTSYNRGAVERLWPLQVGKEANLSVVTQGGGRAIDYKVVRTEAVTVPAGTFQTYLIEKRERTSDNEYEARERMWYAPQIGYFAKYEQDLIRGIDRRQPWDLVSVRRPGLPGAPVAVIPRSDTFDNRVAFCRERGAVLVLADGRRVNVDCDTYVGIERPVYEAWLAR
jgi:hypothetical protein